MDKRKDIKGTWENYYEEDKDTALRDKVFFNMEMEAIQDEVIKSIKYKESIKIAELGCGTGVLAQKILKALEEKGVKCDFVGVDLSENAIKHSNSKKLKGAKFVCEDYFSFFEKNEEKFDLIVTQRSIMALLEKEEQLKLYDYIKGVLVEGGGGIFSEYLDTSFANLNEQRIKFKLEPIEKIWHSRHLRVDELKSKFRFVEIIDYSSTYWLITRVIYPYFEEPKYNTELAHLAASLPQEGNFGLVKLIIVQ